MIYRGFVGRPNNTLVSNQLVMTEIREDIKKFLEPNKK